MSGLVLEGAGSARAQEVTAPSGQKLGFFIGPVGGANFVTYTTDEFNVVSPPTERMAINGSGTGMSLGANLEIPLSGNFRNFITIEALFDSKPGTFTIMNGLTVMPDTPVVNMVGNAGETASLQYLVLDVGYKHNFVHGDAAPAGLAVQLCLSLGVILQAQSTKQIWYYTTGSGFREQDYVGKIEGVRSIQTALRPELLYDFQLPYSMLLTPEFGLDIPLTRVTDSPSWIASSVFAGVALHFAVGQ
jgi:hypothetical protein